MSSIFDNVRLSTIQRLQGDREASEPGSDAEQIADYAIDLCLNISRAAENEHYLRRNVLRDAKKQLYRDRQREQQANARFLNAQGYTLDFSEGLGYTTSSPSSEEEVVTNSSTACEVARAFAPALGPWGPKFLNLLLEGYSVSAAAAAVGVSRATGYRAKEKLAVLLAPMFDMEAS